MYVCTWPYELIVPSCSILIQCYGIDSVGSSNHPFRVALPPCLRILGSADQVGCVTCYHTPRGAATRPAKRQDIVTSFAVLDRCSSSFGQVSRRFAEATPEELHTNTPLIPYCTPLVTDYVGFVRRKACICNVLPVWQTNDAAFCKKHECLLTAVLVSKHIVVTTFAAQRKTAALLKFSALM